VIYLAGLLIVSAFALFLFTAVSGRLWCGFACPQTVYTEIFMWVERRFEGDRQARIKLDAAPWSAHKLLRRGGKQAVWLAIGLWTGFSFVAYFTPARTLAAGAMALNLGPWEWFWSLFYGFATYGNAGYMREQVCKYMCPYARFQSAMFDRDTLIVSYDTARGEPRGARSRKADASALGLGACVDCTLCVQVCPTGIDIRDGLQYECIGCAACIDVCNDVMDKMSYPRGLIRYATQNGMEGRWSAARMWRRVLRPRVLVYTGVLMLIAFGFAAAAASWVILVTLAALFAAIYIPTIQGEEVYLREHFAGFDAYADEVPRLLPRLTAAGRATAGDAAAAKGSFSRELYLRHREYNSAMGAVGLYLALAARLLFFPR